jgi:hypothetical protein
LAAFKYLDPLNAHFVPHMRSNQWFDKLVPFKVDLVAGGGLNHHCFDFGYGKTAAGGEGGVGSVPQPHPRRVPRCHLRVLTNLGNNLQLGGEVCVAEIVNFRLTIHPWGRRG